MMEHYTWTDQDTAGDCRRASVLMLHHLDDNEVGVEAVLSEALDAGRLFPLVLALLDQTVTIAPGIDSEQGRAFLRRGIARLAAQEQT